MEKSPKPLKEKCEMSKFIEFNLCDGDKYSVRPELVSAVYEIKTCASKRPKSGITVNGENYEVVGPYENTLSLVGKSRSREQDEIIEHLHKVIKVSAEKEADIIVSMRNRITELEAAEQQCPYCDTVFGGDASIEKPTMTGMNDVVRLAMYQAAERFGGRDGLFNSANFSLSLCRISDYSGPGLDGKLVAAILSGRSDVVRLSGGAHWKLLEVANHD